MNIYLQLDDNKAKYEVHHQTEFRITKYRLGSSSITNQHYLWGMINMYQVIATTDGKFIGTLTDVIPEEKFVIEIGDYKFRVDSITSNSPYVTVSNSNYVAVFKRID